MPHEFLDGAQVDAGHDEAARERVPQIVPMEVLDAGGLDRGHEDAAHVVARVDRRLAGLAWEDVCALQSALACAQDLSDGVVHGHAARLAVLGAGDREDARREVDVFPFQVELLRLSEAGVHRHRDQRPFVLTDGLTKFGLLLLGEEADALVVLLEELHRADGVRHGLPVRNRYVEDALQESELPVDARGRELVVEAGNVALNVAGRDLAKRLRSERVSPVAAVALVVAIAAKRALGSLQVIVNDVRKGDIAPADLLGKEAPFRDLRFTLAVDLCGERLRADLLAMQSAILVDVADPPDA